MPACLFVWAFIHMDMSEAACGRVLLVEAVGTVCVCVLGEQRFVQGLLLGQGFL